MSTTLLQVLACKLYPKSLSFWILSNVFFKNISDFFKSNVFLSKYNLITVLYPDVSLNLNMSLFIFAISKALSKLINVLYV